MAALDTDVRYIKGIGEKKALAFNKLGVFSLYDLVSYFPRKYEDRSVFVPIAETTSDMPCCIKAIVADTPKLVRIRRGMELVKFRAVDDSGAVDITYFNQNYLRDQFVKGECYCFYGRVEMTGGRRSMANPVHESENADNAVTGRIMPVYRMCAGLTQRNIVDSVRQGLRLCGETLPDVLPDAVREKCGLVQSRFAYENIHFPTDFVTLELARRRFIFEELFVLACALDKMHSERVVESGIKISCADIGEFYNALPFSPTNAQRRAEQLREDAVVLQREVRAGTPAGDDDAAYDFRAATPDGTETGLNAFRVRVRKQTVTARTPSGKTVPFCRFAKGE